MFSAPHRARLSRRIAAVIGCLAALAGPDVFAQTGSSTTGDPFGRSTRDRGADMPDMPRQVFDPQPIFFPPNPPPLGRAIVRSAPLTGRFAPPAELAAYVNEPFYPMLGSRLHARTLNEKLRAQLDRYRAAKTALQEELRAEVDRLLTLDPETRAAEFATLARKQAPQIAELEKSAEQLRRDLIESDQSWGALRQWRLGDHDRRGFSPLEIGQVMRGYAFYQAGLLPAQRRLLREISIELAMAGDNMDNATAQQPYLFFPPEPARVLLPDDLAADVAAKLADYQTRKSKLKKELYDAVHAHDGQKFGFLRGNTLKALADKQAPAHAELEALAEEVRRGLGRVADPITIAERTPLPPLLHHRVATLMAAFGALQTSTATRIDAILAEAKELPMQASYRLEGDGLKFIVVPSRGGRGGRSGRGGGGPSGAPPSPEAVAQINAVRARVSEIADEYGQRVATLINEKDAIRSEIARTLGNSRAIAVDSALMAAMRVVTAKETEGSYRDYRIAVFQAGLSPEQRRLLFDRVVERLELPLPRGELQPIIRAPTW
jgi:hypothetical protein